MTAAKHVTNYAASWRHGHVGWTDDRVLQLRALWREGFSASQVAVELGGGLTRNAVIGKVYRIGLDKRRNNNNPIVKGEIVKRNATRRVVVANLARAALAAPLQPGRPPKPTKLAEVALPPEVNEDEIGGKIEPLPDWTPAPAEGVEIWQLEAHHCRFPLWGHGDRLGKFCGGVRVEPLSYCAGHALLAYQPAAARHWADRSFFPRSEGAR